MQGRATSPSPACPTASRCGASHGYTPWRWRRTSAAGWRCRRRTPAPPGSPVSRQTAPVPPGCPPARHSSGYPAHPPDSPPVGSAAPSPVSPCPAAPCWAYHGPCSASGPVPSVPHRPFARRRIPPAAGRRSYPHIVSYSRSFQGSLFSYRTSYKSVLRADRMGS